MYTGFGKLPIKAYGSPQEPCALVGISTRCKHLRSTSLKCNNFPYQKCFGYSENIYKENLMLRCASEAKGLWFKHECSFSLVIYSYRSMHHEIYVLCSVQNVQPVNVVINRWLLIVWLYYGSCIPFPAQYWPIKSQVKSTRYHFVQVYRQVVYKAVVKIVWA